MSDARNISPKKHAPLLIAVAVLGVGFLAGLGVVLYLYWPHLFHPSIEIDRRAYPVAGIDISSHNGTIDFDTVAAAGYSFVFIKASEGAYYRDSLFAGNAAAARSAGLAVGAYHFFRKSRDGKRQAQNLLGATRGIALDMPLVVDVEDWSNDNGEDSATVRQRLADMISALESQGKQVMIYTNGDGHKKHYLAGGYSRLPLWLCAFKEPSEIEATPHDFQQYSHWGTVPGIKGDVDLNIFNGTREQWETWLKEHKPDK